ncbi:MAG: tetratricopeptide repeat protein [Candidatus Binataceae bacterium]
METDNLLNRVSPLVIVMLLAALAAAPPIRAWADTHPASYDNEICDPLADYFLGMEDYPEAIRRHLIVIHEHPNNALAHYHLGFAYGMMGEHRRELAQYRKAVDLGLDNWELFLNLGLLYLESGHIRDAAHVLQLAALLGPGHPETHFNLALAYERSGAFAQAEQEALISLEIDPNQLDARNTLGTIYAEEGNLRRAKEEWTELIEANPAYTPARANLAILRRHMEAAPVKGLRDTSFTHSQ